MSSLHLLSVIPTSMFQCKMIIKWAFVTGRTGYLDSWPDCIKRLWFSCDEDFWKAQACLDGNVGGVLGWEFWLCSSSMFVVCNTVMWTTS